MPLDSLKFLHLADLHLGADTVGGRLRLPYDKAQVRARELREVLRRTVEIAREESVQVILIAGDLWEEGSGQEEALVVVDYLGRAGLPVVIAPGNHDYYHPASYYSDSLLEARTGHRWPDNIHIFRDYDFTPRTFPELQGVVFSGLAFHSNQLVQSRRLAENIDRPDGALHIAVLHGSRDGGSLPPGKKRTLPFSDEELLRHNFDYAALGHYHSHSVIHDSQGRVRAAYPGAAAALTIDEPGERGCLVGLVRPGGVVPDELRFRELDTRRIVRLVVSLDGAAHSAAVQERIEKSLQDAHVRREDICLVELEGRYPPGSRIDLSDDFLQSACWHLRVDDSAVTADFSLDDNSDPNPRTAEGLFVERLRTMIAEARKRGDEREERHLLSALQFGMEALRGQDVAMR
ncbi:MAG: DNA repair exonuclease [Calditrichaeota bacterium]|nr:DNA repair exonuclease [Calditrichota bacterium]